MITLETHLFFFFLNATPENMTILWSCITGI